MSDRVHERVAVWSGCYGNRQRHLPVAHTVDWADYRTKVSYRTINSSSGPSEDHPGEPISAAKIDARKRSIRF